MCFQCFESTSNIHVQGRNQLACSYDIQSNDTLQNHCKIHPVGFEEKTNQFLKTSNATRRHQGRTRRWAQEPGKVAPSHLWSTRGRVLGHQRAGSEARGQPRPHVNLRPLAGHSLLPMAEPLAQAHAHSQQQCFHENDDGKGKPKGWTYTF